MGDHRPHGNAALAQAADRPRAGPALADVPGLVRGAIRRRCMGDARQDPTPAMDGLPALVPPRAAAGGPQRASRQDRAAARRRCGRADPRHAGRSRAARAGAPRGAGHRPRRPGRPGRAGVRAPPAAPLVGAFVRCDGLRRAGGQTGGRDRRGRVGHGFGRHRAGSRRRERRSADPPPRPAPHQQGQGRGQPGAGPWPPASAGRLEMAHPPLHQCRAGAAAARQHAARVAAPERALQPRLPLAGRGRAQRCPARDDAQGRVSPRLPDLFDGLSPRLGGAPRVQRARAARAPLARSLHAPPRRGRRGTERLARPRPRLRIAREDARPAAGTVARALLLLPGVAHARQRLGRHPGHQRRRAPAGAGHRRAAVPGRHRRPLRRDAGLRRAGDLRRRVDARAAAAVRAGRRGRLPAREAAR